MEIRTARPDEHGAIRAVTRAAYAEYADVMEPAAWSGLANAVETALAASTEAEWIAAVEDDRIVGSVLLFRAATQAYSEAVSELPWPELRLLAVAPDVRSRGVGRALVAECARRAKQAGATAIGLHTSRSMAVARRMYEQLGFVRVPERDFQPPGAEVVEGYRLDLG